jgi:hypothetical protein
MNKIPYPRVTFDTGIAKFGNKTEYVPYPFKLVHYFAIPSKISSFSQYSFIKIDPELLIEKEEWVLDVQLPGSTELLATGYTVYYPEAHYRRVR